MKTNLKKFPLWLCVLAALAGFNRVCSGAVAVTLTPNVVSNTYDGKITLQVTGLNPGDSVVVQKYLDANTNSMVDAGDILVQQFNLTDGQAAVFSGVTNGYVPGDTDTTAGQITAALHFQDGDFTQNFVAQYLYVVYSASGSFAPLTNLFTVTNALSGQSFTGSVVNSGTNVPYAGILALSGTGKGGPVGGVVADSAGNYTLVVPPGSYSLVATKSNFVGDVAAAANLVLGAGTNLSTNLTLIGTTQTISGKLIDANNSSIGLPGLLLPVEANSLLGIAYTDTNGNFSAGVNAGQWKTDVNNGGLVVHGYLSPQNKMQVDTTSGSVSGLTIALAKGTALFYGTIEDSQSNGLAGVSLYSQDNTNGYEEDVITTGSGKYWAVALGGTSGDPWDVQISNDSNTGFSNYLFSIPLYSQNGGTNISVGEAVEVDFTAIIATNQISGFLHDSGGNPISNVQVYASAVIGGQNYQPNANTDNNGNYSFNVGNGDWSVSVFCGGGNNSLDSALGAGNYQCPNSQDTNIVNTNAVVNFTVLPPYTGPYQISGVVTNRGGNPVAGVHVYASDGVGDNLSTMTDGGGHYLFNVGNGSWNLDLDCNDLSSQGYGCASGQQTNVSGGSVVVNFTVLPTYSGGPYQISGVVTNNGGTPVAGVHVYASDGVGDNLSTTTDGGGHYFFSVGNANWNVNVDCSDLNLQGYACPGGQPANVSGASVVVNFSVQPCGSLAVQTTSLPDTIVGASYNAQLNNSGCDGPFTWTLTPGSLALPPGFGLSPTGVLSAGVVSNADIGTNYFSVRVTDNQANTADQPLSLAVYPALQVAFSGSTTGTVGVYYSAQLLVSGGDPFTTGFPYNAYLLSGSYPPGLNPSYGTVTSSNASFVLSGTPTQSGIFPFVGVVSDADGNQVTNSYSITIASGAALQITTTTLSNAQAGAFYTNQLQATGGTPPYTWTVALGSQPLPTGLNLAGSGALSGVPAAGGTSNFIVRVTDHVSATLTRALQLVINPKPVLSSPFWQASRFQMRLTGAAGQNYTVQMSTNLSNWTSLYVTNNGLANSFLVSDPNATNKQRSYRILVGP